MNPGLEPVQYVQVPANAITVLRSIPAHTGEDRHPSLTLSRGLFGELLISEALDTTKKSLHTGAPPEACGIGVLGARPPALTVRGCGLHLDGFCSVVLAAAQRVHSGSGLKEWKYKLTFWLVCCLEAINQVIHHKSALYCRTKYQLALVKSILFKKSSQLTEREKRARRQTLQDFSNPQGVYFHSVLGMLVSTLPLHCCGHNSHWHQKHKIRTKHNWRKAVTTSDIFKNKALKPLKSYE